jgi:hypothetical protein
MTDEEWAARLAAREDEDEPADPELDPDPEDCAPPPGEDELTAGEIAECREISAAGARAAAHAAKLGAAGALAAAAAALGRRGPGQPGSAHWFPGEYPGPAAGFATGMPLDTAPGCPALASFADDVAGDGDSYAGVSDDELVGALCAWDRAEAHAAARKHAAMAELIRRRPARGFPVDGKTRMPLAWDEFTADELADALAQSRQAAEIMLELTHDLEMKLPGTKAAFLAGILCQSKVAIIARACQVLDPAEAQAAEARILGRAGSLTPPGLRSAIARAVAQVAPGKARRRREQAAKDARVERWAEDSGNAALVGRELPPAEVLAADQRVTAWAKELKKAGLDGSTDELRARAYLDLLLGLDSRPAPPAAASQDASDVTHGRQARDGAGGTARDGNGGPGKCRRRAGEIQLAHEDESLVVRLEARSLKLAVEQETVSLEERLKIAVRVTDPLVVAVTAAEREVSSARGFLGRLIEAIAFPFASPLGKATAPYVRWQLDTGTWFRAGGATSRDIIMEALRQTGIGAQVERNAITAYLAGHPAALEAGGNIKRWGDGTTLTHTPDGVDIVTQGQATREQLAQVPAVPVVPGPPGAEVIAGVRNGAGWPEPAPSAVTKAHRGRRADGWWGLTEFLDRASRLAAAGYAKARCSIKFTGLAYRS